MIEPLKKPPLIEAACEFRFNPESEWDWTIPGRLFDKIGDEFSERSEVRRLGLTVQESDKQTPSPTLIESGPDRIHLKRSDGSAIVQIGPRLLAISLKRPYPNWETYRELILRIYEAHREIAGASKLARLGLRYINKIPMKKLAFTDVITVWPTLAGALNRYASTFYQRYELKHDNPKGTLIHQTGLQTVDGKSVIMLDLDFVSVSVGRLKRTESIEKWLDLAHERIEEGFIETLVPDFFEKLKKS